MSQPSNSNPSSHHYQVYLRLLRYLKPYYGRLALGIFFGLIYAGSNGALLWTLKKGIQNVFGLAPDSAPNFSQTILIAALILFASAVRGVSDYLSKYLIRWCGSRVVVDLRNALFHKLNELSLSYFVASRSGDLIARTTNDTSLVENAVSNVVEDAAKQPPTLIVLIGVLFWLDPMLALGSLLLFPVCILPVTLFGRRVRRFSREGQQRISDLVSILQEAIVGVRVVKAFGMEESENARFNAQNRSFFSRVMRVVRAQCAVEPLMVFISMVGVAAVLFYIRWRAMPFDSFITFAGALVMMYGPVKSLSRVHLQIQLASGGADRIFEVLDAPVEVANRVNARRFEGRVESVEFDHVSFAYGAQPILRDISLTVTAGQRVALVGGSGAGKTTFVNLLPRFYDPTSGALRINGTDIRDLTLDSLRRTMGIVTQDTVLFNDTVVHNICYGTPDATMEAVIEAAQRAHADEFIRTLPKGYDTPVGDLGMRLSGGQRQRIAIARACLRNPAILILDEATSALDTESERAVQAALETLMESRTVFVIAHRLSTIIKCDRILVLAGGQVIEEGTHDALLARGGAYRRLYDLQFTAE
ncbi:MAG: ABC transporter ATP-binding protein [bacterium]